MPTCSSTSAGRPISILVDIYRNNKKKLSEYDTIDSKVYVSKFQGLSLKEYVSVKKYLCDSNHSKLTSCDCSAFINLSQTVLSSGICCLSNVFKKGFPNVTYQSFNARRKVLHMPCVVFTAKT